MDEYLYFILLVEYEGVPIIVRGVEHTVEQGIFWSIYTDDLSPAAQNNDFLKFMSQKWEKIKMFEAETAKLREQYAGVKQDMYFPSLAERKALLLAKQEEMLKLERDKKIALFLISFFHSFLK